MISIFAESADLHSLLLSIACCCLQDPTVDCHWKPTHQKPLQGACKGTSQSSWRDYLCENGVQETRVWSLGWEDPLEDGMATHSSILAWRIQWTEEPGGLQSTGSQKAGHDWVTNTHAHNIVVTSLFSDDFWNSPYHIAVRKVTTDIFHRNLYLSGFKVNPLKSNLCYCSRHHWSDVCAQWNAGGKAVS